MRKRLKELEMFSLEKRTFSVDIIGFKYLKDRHKKDGEKLFSLAMESRTRGNVF